MIAQTWNLFKRVAGIAIASFSGMHAFAEDSVEYNREVLPILADRCFACHGFDKGTRKAGLRLDSHVGATAKLESGLQAVVPRRPAESELIRRIVSTDPDEMMPPPSTGQPLTEAQRQLLERWVQQGARYEVHWAFIPPKPIEPPAVSGSVHPIDRFVRTRLLKESISPAPEAERTTQIRRLSFDLTGLPPSVLEIDAFVNDPRPDAYERVVDRLLGSEHFGERWARWWLDLAHYAHSDGYLQDFLRPFAWRYREWVVDAFNRDLPFDQFTIEQLAGDLLTDATAAQKIGTGFLRNTLSNREGGADLEEYRIRQVVDRLSMVGTTWLGLTVGCAECHDHKFDAISQREFYQLFAFFNNADEVNIDAPLAGEAEPYFEALRNYDRKRVELLAPAAKEIEGLQAEWEAKLLWTEVNPGHDHRWDRALEVIGLIWGQSLGEGQLEGLNIVKTAVSARTSSERHRLQDYFLRNGSIINPQKFTELKLADLSSKLDALGKELPALSRAQTMTRSRRHRVTHIHKRGDFRQPGDEVQPQTLAVLPQTGADESPDRLKLARWMVSRENPLTPRVTVNRLWQELFGRGLVRTSENFGVRGERPTHPELLDWLALNFVENGWSVKSILRQIVLSQTYRQSSTVRPELNVIDPQNALLARQERLRLPGEMIRDAALASSGLLTRTVGGPSVRPPQPDSVTKEGFSNEWVSSRGPDRYRRGLYTFLQRTSPFAQLVTFDLPDTSRSCTRRERSNTPTQALNLLNDQTFIDAAQALAIRILREEQRGVAQRLNHAFLLTLSRSPTTDEVKRLSNFLDKQIAAFAADPQSTTELVPELSVSERPHEQAAWTVLASVLLNLDETITRE